MADIGKEKRALSDKEALQTAYWGNDDDFSDLPLPPPPVGLGMGDADEHAFGSLFNKPLPVWKSVSTDVLTDGVGMMDIKGKEVDSGLGSNLKYRSFDAAPAMSFPASSFWESADIPSSHSKLKGLNDVLIEPALVKSSVQASYIEPPESPGNFLEPYHHLRSTAKPSVLLEQTIEALRTCPDVVDFSVKHDKFKLKCTSMKFCKSLQFNARIFTIKPNEEYAVEFQRRQGCPMHFCNIYAHCKKVLVDSKLVQCDGSSSSTKATTVMVPPPSSEDIVNSLQKCGGSIDGPKLSQCQSTVKALLQMAESEFVDVKGQAVTAIAQLTSGGYDVEKLLMNAGVCDTLKKCAESSSRDILCCVATCLANLASKENLCDKFQDLVGVAVNLIQSNSKTGCHLLRESMRFLANMKKVGKFDTSEELEPTLTDLSTSACATTSGYANELLKKC